MSDAPAAPPVGSLPSSDGAGERGYDSYGIHAHMMDSTATWQVLFDKFGVKASCTTNAKTCLERRPIIDAAKERGWELVAHNYVQTELLTNYSFDRDKEKEIIGRTLEVYDKVIGRPAKGWLSSSMRCTTNTPEILTEYGLIFQADWLNDDQPFVDKAMKYVMKHVSPTSDNTGHHYYTQLYFAQALYQRGGKDWDDYYAKFSSWLLRQQKKDGSWEGDGVGSVYGTAIALIILQLLYSLVPIYQR